VSLRTGITTGTCAAAAAKAAVCALVGLDGPTEVSVALPGGQRVAVPLLGVGRAADRRWAMASVRKDAGDDPDVTDGVEVRATVSWTGKNGITFSAGEGVGTVTRPGLQIPPGEPAINPVPRRMIATAIGERGNEEGERGNEEDPVGRGVHVEIAIPGGGSLAAKTFNPRLGIEGGLSILGTSGIVRPYCRRALEDALRCSLDVAAACGTTAPVLVPGAIGARAARLRFPVGPEQVIEVANAWEFMLGLVPEHGFRALMILGHPGKLAKLAWNNWDTHSARSVRAVEVVAQWHAQVLGRPAADFPTTEGIFQALPPPSRKELGDALSRAVRQAVEDRLEGQGGRGKAEGGRRKGEGGGRNTESGALAHPHAARPRVGRGGSQGHALPVAVMLVDMAGLPLGSDGDLTPWR
jgi:cobalt-precorrin-5B (C1)-methyltransferase